ncbi:UNVERIFIED_CONTAM: Pentatricopeptide repeat-containing protein, chloroplastic [Sesamum radiatum]|uniref:Pentatricopeptide repeat-containing protein, chloroplastic n=1 Tax=Sesamum radiatum TaxID=300843 RepID=A0AAW2TUA9_SESRA
MHSFTLRSPVSLSWATVNHCNSNVGEPKINHATMHYPLLRENTFSNALSSLRTCTENEDPRLGSCFHAQIMKLGVESDVFIGNSLINMYSKCDHIRDAENLFDHMPNRTIVSWTSMMSAYQRNGLADETILLFLRMLESLQPNEFTLAVALQACALKGYGDLIEVIQCFAIKSGLILDDFLQNCLVDAYAKLGMLRAAAKLLQGLYRRDVVCWTSVISGCVCNGNAKTALALFCRMQENGVLPNDVTMLTILKACSEINDRKVMQWIHGLVLKGSWCVSELVLNSLIEMYSTNGYFRESLTIFCHFCFRNEGLYPSPETMASLLQGCGNCGSLKLGEEIHGYLIKQGFLPCTVAENSLMNMYTRNGCVDSAFILFRTMAKRDVISWNTIINCFVKNNQPVTALGLLGEIHREGSRDNVYPDFVTLLASLEACSDLALLIQGEVLHGYLTSTGLLGDIFVQNALIDMYAKSGRLDSAENIVKEMHERDIGSWNSIIAAYGINGNGTSALKVFADLERSGTMKPNAITFTNVLSACAHAGLVEEGFKIFNSMEKHHNTRPSMEHFACMVDLLGRAGRVEEAEMFIYKMPMQPGPDVWAALLGACVVVGNVTIAEKAAKELAVMEPSSSIWRVALSNAYAAAGKWQEAAEIRAEFRRSKQFVKEGGWSSVNVEGYEFTFMAGDTKHPESAMIYGIIGTLQHHMQDRTSLCSNAVLT